MVNITKKKRSKKNELLINIILGFTSVIIFWAFGEILTRVFFGSPLITQPDEILFWKYKKAQTGHQKLYSPITTVDKYGFRFSGKTYNPNLPEIYVGGDSYAWGDGVLDTETFAAQLQTILDQNNLKYCVLNGGVPGYGIAQIIDRMEIECTKYHPKYAIFLWAETDISRLRNMTPEMKKKFLRDYRLRSMFRYSAFLKLIKDQIIDKLLHTNIQFGYRGDRIKEYENTHTFDEKVADLTPLIKENVAFLRRKNIVPIWAFITVPSQEFRKYLTSLSKELSIVLVNPEETYKRHYPGLQNMATEHSGHFKPNVYKLLADEVFNNAFLKKKSLLSTQMSNKN